MPKINVEIRNLFQLRVVLDAPGELFAFYLYKDNELLEKHHYTSERETLFFLRNPGVYRVKGFFRTREDAPERVLSGPIDFKGLVSTPKVEEAKRVFIVGVSTISAFVAKVFEKNYEIAGFVDPTGKYVGQQFFGYPVVESSTGDYRLIGHQNYLPEFPQMESFDLRVGNSNTLSDELNRHGAMEMYRISRDCHLNGLREGANYLSNTILRRYNSRVPHEAIIGDGVKLGVGGMGIAIHPKSIVGDNCTIGQNVTLGIRAGGNGSPIIGDNVFIAPGAKCLGGKIGDNSIVGANAVVIDEVPANCIVAGVPAKIIRRDTSAHKSYTHRNSR